MKITKRKRNLKNSLLGHGLVQTGALPLVLPEPHALRQALRETFFRGQGHIGASCRSIQIRFSFTAFFCAYVLSFNFSLKACCKIFKDSKSISWEFLKRCSHNFENYYGSRHHMSFWRGNRLHSYVKFHGFWSFIVPIIIKSEHKFDAKIEGIEFPPKKRWGVQEKNTFVSKIDVAEKCVVTFLI